MSLVTCYDFAFNADDLDADNHGLAVAEGGQDVRPTPQMAFQTGFAKSTYFCNLHGQRHRLR